MKNISAKLFLLLILSLFLILTNTCKKLEKVMLVSTGEISSILTNSAEASGMVIDAGEGATQHGHCYGTAPNVTTAGMKTAHGVPAGNGGFTSLLTGLEAGTKYYVKAYLSNGAETVYGNEVNFTTNSASLPTLTTTAPSLITTTSAVSGGNITSNGGTPVTERGVCWSTSVNPSISDSNTSDGSGTGSFVSDLTGLTASTTYYVRAYATNDVGTSYGNEHSFTTGGLTIPAISTTSISEITQSSATSGGNISSDGGAEVIARGVCWNTAPNPTTTNSKTSDGTGTGSFTSNLIGLTAGTEYWVRAYATNSEGTAYGDEISFTTSAGNPTPPTAASSAATSVTNTTAIVNGAVNANGSSTIVTFEYGTTNLYGSTAVANQSPVTGVSATTVDATLTGLIPGTLYHFRVKAISSEGTTYSDDLTFTTQQTPTVTTEAATSITTSTAILNGTVNANNLSTDVTFEYGTSISYGNTITAAPNPVTGGNPTSVSADISGLTPGTEYHYRIKAVSAGGTEYGEDISFTSLHPPSAVTDVATNITINGATLNASINANNSTTNVTFEYGLTTDYGSSITADQSPISGSALTNVTADITGLTPGQTYHFKVRAVSPGGTTEGSDLSFTTLLLPVAVTTAASDITNTTANLNGNINANNLSTTVTFEYGLTIAYGETIMASQSPVEGNSEIGVSASVSDLIEGSDYHFRVKATSEAGTVYGEDLIFTTDQFPVAVTGNASAVTDSSATLNGTVNATNLPTTVTFEYGTSISYGLTATATPDPVTGDIPVSVTVDIKDLSADVLYHFRVKAVSSGGTVYGDDKTFTTLCTAPFAETGIADFISSAGALVSGLVNANNFSTIVSFEYGRTTGYGSSIEYSSNPVTGNSNSSVFAFINDLPPDTITEYHYRVKAVNCGGTVYGDDQTFMTLCGRASSTTNNASNIDYTTATLNGSVNANNSITTVTFEYGLTTGYGSTITANPGSVSGNSDVTVSGDISGLSSGTLYHYRLKTVNCGGTSYSTDQTFTTLCYAPTATTNSASNLNVTTATLNGTVNANNSSTIVTFEYGLNTGYGNTITASQSPVSGSTNTLVSAGPSGLVSNIVYHYRVNAVNCGGTVYGSDLTFTTLPSVTTTAISNITGVSASSGGSINLEGAAAIYTRGVCWSTSTNPTIADSKTTNGGGEGNFTSNLTGLAPLTTYYVRAYATNSAGTAYGNQLSFSTTLCPPTLTVTHTAGNVAPVSKTITYGIVETNLSGANKCWITRNLGADNQAASATEATEPAAGWYWQFNRRQGYKHDGSTRTPSSTWITSINEDNNWIASYDPCTILLGTGWRVPTSSEWTNVKNNDHWNNYNDTYSSVIKLHAAGHLYDWSGSLAHRGVTGNYWTSTQSSNTYSWCLNFGATGLFIQNDYFYKSSGLSIRCIKD